MHRPGFIPQGSNAYLILYNSGDVRALKVVHAGGALKLSEF